VALNCVANGRVLREGPFERIWIQPASGDAGSALGVALFIWHQLLGHARQPRAEDSQRGSLIGQEFSDEEIQAFLARTNAVYTRVDDEDTLVEQVADLLASGKVVGWFQGRMEFGPRALGSRSILGDSRRPEMQSVINQKVKFREGFRPFAPAVLAEYVDEYFDHDRSHDSPYMLIVCPVSETKRLELDDAAARATGFEKLRTPRSTIPAITHVDYSARIQTVDDRHGLYRRLIEAFHRKTGCPVLVNTSFNLGWEPIVRTAEEAFETFMSCDIDALCLGPHILTKAAQPSFVSVGGDLRTQHILGDMLASPCCGAEMEAGRDGFRCANCRHGFAIEDGIAHLFWPHDSIEHEGDVTESVKAFYEETPFPNYDDHDTLRSLIDKSRRGGYAHQLQRAIPFNSTTLEVGCGTGQLSNFLGISCRRVVGSDLCLNSLRLGEAFRRKHELDRVQFVQMNLFRPAFKRGYFDVVLCNGVLHHTSDPFGGFRSLAPLVRPGGHIVIGLYGRYGRLMTDLRRHLFRMTGGRAHWIDPHLRRVRIAADKERAWFADQYQHPHESKHTIGEVMKWFRAVGFDFVRGVPPVRPDGDPMPEGGLFSPEPAGGSLDHFLVQATHVITGNREGGFFVMIGKRPEPS
jgi:SAM-dependent methyltransferase